MGADRPAHVIAGRGAGEVVTLGQFHGQADEVVLVADAGGDDVGLRLGGGRAGPDHVAGRIGDRHAGVGHRRAGVARRQQRSEAQCDKRSQRDGDAPGGSCKHGKPPEDERPEQRCSGTGLGPFGGIPVRPAP